MKTQEILSRISEIIAMEPGQSASEKLYAIARDLSSTVRMECAAPPAYNRAAGGTP